MDSASSILRPRSLMPGRIDLLQALTGVLLALFVLLHFFVVSTVLISPRLMSGLEHFFETLRLTQIGLPGLFCVILLHFLLAARKMPFRAGESRRFWTHARNLRHTGTWLWALQVITAICILALFGAHFYEIQMNLPVTLDATAARTARSGSVLFYALLLLATLAHALIGLFRAGAKFGFITRANRPKWTRILLIVGCAYAVVAGAALVRLALLA